MIPFNIIVAVDQDFGIGKDGKMPWHIPGDLKHFRDITSSTTSKDKSNVVIMGRKTWDSLPDKFKPLPGRINFVLSRQKDLSLGKDVFVRSSMENILNEIDSTLKDVVEEIFVIGGAQLYNISIRNPLCEKIYLTQILEKFECDTFFDHDLSNFEKVYQSNIFVENTLSYFFAEYIQKSISK